MQVTIEVPEDVCQAIAASHSLDRTALEGLAAEAYRLGGITEQQLRRLLGLPSRFAVHAWLASRRIPLQYSESDLADDLTTLYELGLR